MTTRKTLIINQYLRMSKDIEIKIDKKLPCIDDTTKYDFVDLVTLFTYHFIDISDDNHKDKIDTIIEMLNIELSQIEKDEVYPIFYNFIKWFKNLH